MTGICVRREKAALSSGYRSHPANAPAGSYRSSVGDRPMIMPLAAFDFWLEGETVEALNLQLPLQEGMLGIVA
jgi:hypothetical protein